MIQAVLIINFLIQSDCNEKEKFRSGNNGFLSFNHANRWHHLYLERVPAGGPGLLWL